MTALPTHRDAQVTRLSDYDADGMARFRVEWNDAGLPQEQVITATVAQLTERLARNGFSVSKPKEVQ